MRECFPRIPDPVSRTIHTFVCCMPPPSLFRFPCQTFHMDCHHILSPFATAHAGHSPSLCQPYHVLLSAYGSARPHHMLLSAYDKGRASPPSPFLDPPATITCRSFPPHRPTLLPSLSSLRATNFQQLHGRVSCFCTGKSLMLQQKLSYGDCNEFRSFLRVFSFRISYHRQNVTAKGLCSWTRESLKLLPM